MLQLLERVSRISHFRLKVSFSSLISVPPTGRDIQLSHNSTKVHATMPIGIMGSNSLALLGWGSRCLARGKETAWIHLFVLLQFLSNAEKPIVTHNKFRHCRVHFYSFVRQPFSKQLYDESWSEVSSLITPRLPFAYCLAKYSKIPLSYHTKGADP